MNAPAPTRPLNAPEAQPTRPAAGTPAQRFLRDAAEKSADLVHREIIRKGMDSYEAAHQKGRSRFKDWEAARRRCQEIKREAVGHLDKYLLQFEANVLAHGGHVFWAEDSAQACAYVCGLAERHKVKTVVKSKSIDRKRKRLKYSHLGISY